MRQWSTIAGCGLLLFAVGVTLPLLAQTSAPATRRADAGQINALAQQGADALAVADYKAARDTFLDVIQIDSRNPRGWHGLALAYLGLNEPQKAVAAIDKAVAMPGAATDHNLAINAAAVHVQAKAPMRAVKILREHMTAKPNPVNEQAANALAVALDRADGTARRNPFWADSRRFYDSYVKRMEQANPGYLRWGLQWRTAEQVQELLKQNANAQPRLDAARKDLTDLEQRVTTAQRELDRRIREFQNGRMAEWMVVQQRFEVQQLEDQLPRRRDRVDEAARHVIVPAAPPETIAAVALDAPIAVFSKPVLPPQPAVAVGDGTTTNPPSRRPKRPTTQNTDPASETPIAKAKPPAETPANPVEPAQPAARKKVRLTAYAAAFPVAPDLVITSAPAVEHASDITMQLGNSGAITGTVVRVDAATGLALVRLNGAKMAFLPLADPAAGKITCPTFPEVNIFAPTPEALPGTCAAAGANWTIRFARHPRLAGAPLVQDGKVVGVVTGTRESDPAAFPAVPVAAVRALLGADAPKGGSANPDPLTTLLHLTAVRERE